MTLNNIIQRHISDIKHIAPLAILRIAFGAILLISTLRFIAKGWIKSFYIKPQFFFTFYGFEWVKPMEETGMCLVFGIMVLASLFILLGFYYRISIIAFFISFVYVEMLDITNYLNHYYFVSVFTLLMMLTPAHRYFSLDVLHKPSLKRTHVPAWTINIFKLQLFIVYFYAGLAKLNSDWMLQAMPLRIWLPGKSNLFLIGDVLRDSWTAYVFSWFGALYDLLIGFLLLYKPTRSFAYLMVIVFHLFTAMLFNIGMFPYIMICVTIIFFSEEFHIRLIEKLRSAFSKTNSLVPEGNSTWNNTQTVNNVYLCFLLTYFLLQLTIPFRYLLYPGNLFWTEEGYRFSWRVMLMEKAGSAFFYLYDPKTGQKSEIQTSAFLTPLQEKMMVTQPDMILQYAHFLDNYYQKSGIADPIITVEDYVTLNGSGSRLFINPDIDLSKEQESLLSKKWILPFSKN